MNTATQATLFSSVQHDWRTPPALFAACTDRFFYALDAAASAENALCPYYFTEADDALRQDWNARAVWVNPPYGRALGRWLAKAAAETAQGHARLVTLLIPARTDTRFWHEQIMTAAAFVWLFKGRITFLDPNGREQAPAPFPSALVGFAWPARRLFRPRFASVDLATFTAPYRTEEAV